MDVHKTLSAGEAPPRLGEAKPLHFSVGWAQHAHMLKCHSSADTWQHSKLWKLSQTLFQIREVCRICDIFLEFFEILKNIPYFSVWKMTVKREGFFSPCLLGTDGNDELKSGNASLCQALENVFNSSDGKAWSRFSWEVVEPHLLEDFRKGSRKHCPRVNQDWRGLPRRAL